MLNKYITVNIGQRAHYKTVLVSVSQNAVAVVAVYAVADCHHVMCHCSSSDLRDEYSSLQNLRCTVQNATDAIRYSGGQTVSSLQQ